MLRATGTESTVVHVTVSFVPALVVTSGLPGTWREQRRGVDIVQDSVWSIYPKGLSSIGTYDRFTPPNPSFINSATSGKSSTICRPARLLGDQLTQGRRGS